MAQKDGMRSRQLLPLFLIGSGILLSGCSDTDPEPTTIPRDDVPPGRVDDLRLSSWTDDALTLIWTSPGDDEFEGQAWRYDMRRYVDPIGPWNWDKATQISGEPPPSRPGRDDIFIILGLDTETEYHFALRTIDDMSNVSEISNVVFVGLDDAPDHDAPDAIDDLTALILAPERVRLKWTATGDDGGRGTASGYIIRYAGHELRDDNFRDSTFLSETPFPQPSGTPEEIDVTVPGARGEIWFAIQVWDEANNSSPVSANAMVAFPTAR